MDINVKNQFGAILTFPNSFLPLFYSENGDPVFLGDHVVYLSSVGELEVTLKEGVVQLLRVQDQKVFEPTSRELPRYRVTKRSGLKIVNFDLFKKYIIVRNKKTKEIGSLPCDFFDRDLLRQALSDDYVIALCQAASGECLFEGDPVDVNLDNVIFSGKLFEGGIVLPSSEKRHFEPCPADVVLDGVVVSGKLFAEGASSEKKYFDLATIHGRCCRRSIFCK